MYTAIRCPRCLVTIYTVFSPGPDKFHVQSLADESLLFYNCPVALCAYCFNTDHNINLYTNAQFHHTAYASPGFTTAPRTGETKPFRSPAQVAALANTAFFPQGEVRNPSFLGVQAGDEAQPDKTEQVESGDASVPAVPQANRSTRFQRWTSEEMSELERLCNEGHGHEEIAKKVDRSASAVKNKISLMRSKGDLPVQATSLKRKRDN